MFKSWRSDKNKIKAVFKLQFQATQVPKLKKPALIISLVPDDVGKPTFKLEKAPIQDGSCLWESPIYVSVKLIRETKTGKIHEKIYHFSVTTGSSKSGYLGEASIDFADFVAEARPLTVSLPLKFANSGAVLHVTIEKIQGDQGTYEGNGYPALSKEGSLNSQLNNDDIDGYDQNIAEDRLRGSMGSDASGQDGPEPNTRAPDRQNSMPQRREGNLTTTRNGHRRSNTDWSASSASDGSFVESRNSPEDNYQNGWAEDLSDSIDKSKAEIVTLRRQVDMSDLEMQSLRKQVAKESKRTQELSGELKCLKEERDELYTECEQFRLQKSLDDEDAEKRLRSMSEDSSIMIEEIKEELNREKEFCNNLRLQLQKTEESNSNLILAVRDLNEMLEQKNGEIASLSVKREEEVNSRVNINEDEHQSIHDGEELANLNQTIADMHCQLESYGKANEELEMQVKKLMQENKIIKGENFEFSSKLEQQEQMLLQHRHSEHMIKELESQIEALEERIKQQSEEYSESLTTVNELEAQVRRLKKELEEKARVFEDDLNAVMRAKTEQEQRAIQAEDDLRKMRSRNAVAAERLQEKCKRLSAEMASKLDENEKQTKTAETEAYKLRIEKKNLEEMFQHANKELRQSHDQYEVKLEELSNQIEKMRLELDDKSKQLECIKKDDEEKHKTLTVEIEMLQNELESTKRRSTENSGHSKETDVVTQRWIKEREDLEKKLASAREEMEKAQAQLLATRSTKTEKETTIRNLKKEVESLGLRYKELQNSLTHEQKEKETLRKQIAKLKIDLQKKEENVSKKLIARNGESRTEKELKVSASPSKEEGNLAKLLEELAFFKDRNNSMERELKEMEERYSEISLKFAEVEGERQQLIMTVRNLKNGKKP